MPLEDPSQAEVEAFERENRARRDARARIAQEKAEAANASPPPPGHTMKIRILMGPDRLTDEQVIEAASAYRANYARYDDDEIIKLMEAKLAAAFRADGYKLPLMPAKDRLRVLRERAARGG